MGGPPTGPVIAYSALKAWAAKIWKATSVITQFRKERPSAFPASVDGGELWAPTSENISSLPSSRHRTQFNADSLILSSITMIQSL
jgi:hypothetical protein